MALEFALSIDTEGGPMAALSILSAGLNLEWTQELRLRGPAAIIGAFSKGPLGQAVIAEGCGQNPSIVYGISQSSDPPKPP